MKIDKLKEITKQYVTRCGPVCSSFRHSPQNKQKRIEKLEVKTDRLKETTKQYVTRCGPVCSSFRHSPQNKQKRIEKLEVKTDRLKGITQVTIANNPCSHPLTKLSALGFCLKQKTILNNKKQLTMQTKYNKRFIRPALFSSISTKPFHTADP